MLFGAVEVYGIVTVSPQSNLGQSKITLPSTGRRGLNPSQLSLRKNPCYVVLLSLSELFRNQFFFVSFESFRGIIGHRGEISDDDGGGGDRRKMMPQTVRYMGIKDV